MRVRAGARACARGSSSDFDQPKVIFGKCESCWDSHRWWPLGVFDFLAKPVKFYRRAYMFWWNWFQDSRKTQVLNYLERIYYATKLTRRKNLHTKKSWLFRNEWSSFDRLLQPELLTTRGSGIMTISYRKPKNLNRLRISLAPNKVLFLATSASGTWFSEINIFRCSLCFDLFTESLQCSECKTLRSSMVYEVLKWYTKTTRMLYATLQNLSVPLRKSDYLPWDTGLTILAIHLKLLWNPNDNL